MKSKKFCVAVEGATVDGRVIEGAWIDEMAADYNPATYTANVNIEHVRGYSPEPPFNNYGHIAGLEAGTIELQIAGKTETKKALFAIVDANDNLVTLAKDKQKRFPSIEINPNFAGRGRCYCVGLAMSDSPASLGTEMLQFAAGAKVHPLAHRKQDAGNFFSATDSFDGVVLEFEGETPAGAVQGFSLDQVIAGIKKTFTAAPNPAPAAASQPTGAPAVTAEAFTAALEQINATLKLQGEQFTAAQQRSDQLVAQTRSELTAFRAQVEKTPEKNFTQRPVGTGGDGVVLADC